MAGQWDVQQQVAILADHVNEELDHGLRRLIRVFFQTRAVVMPASDAGVGLPWIRLNSVRLTHFKVANQGIQN